MLAFNVVFNSSLDNSLHKFSYARQQSDRSVRVYLSWVLSRLEYGADDSLLPHSWHHSTEEASVEKAKKLIFDVIRTSFNEGI